VRFLLVIICILFALSVSSNNQIIDSLRRVLPAKKGIKEKAEIFINISKEYLNLNTDSAIYYSGKARRMLDKSKYPAEFAQATYYIGLAYKKQYQLDVAMDYYNEAIEIRTLMKDSIEISKILNAIGNIYNEKGDYATSIKYLQKSLDIRILLKDEKAMANTMFNIANNYIKWGDYQKAYDFLKQSRELFEKTGDESGIASCLNLTAAIFEQWKDMKNAKKAYFKALEIRTKLEHFYEMIDLYNNLGNLYNNIDSIKNQKSGLDSALYFYNKSLSLSILQKDRNREALSLKNIGSTYSDMENFSQADLFFKKSLSISEELGLKDLEINVLLAIGISYTYQGKCNNALVYLEKSLSLATEINNAAMMSNNYDYLSLTHMCLGNSTLAKKYHDVYADINNDANNELNDLRIKYETENKQKEILLLNKQQELDQQKLSLQDARMNNQMLVIYGFVFVVIIILVFSIVVFRKFRQKQKANLLLENQNQMISKQNSEISIQRDHLKIQKEEIEDSIRYAKRIQNAVLPSIASAEADLGHHFIIFRPKDVVSGDFYWFNKTADKLIAAVADCTGHGVPGAFMSMLGISFLNEIVRSNDAPDAAGILNRLRLSIVDALKQTGQSGTQKDGMDMSLIVIDNLRMTNDECHHAQWAGANNPLYIIRSPKNLQGFENLVSLEEIKADKMPIAIYERMDEFTNHAIELASGDRLYLFSDGFADQFGGPKGKKFMYKSFKNLLTESSEKSMSEQGIIVENALQDWINHINPATNENYEQVDDITIIGIEV
jgi:serine phosphatase RsbU (regulator of sigma subunit)